MTNEEFVVWLAGFFELSEGTPSLTKHQFFIINNHLNLAEAVEGELGPFNTEMREIVKAELSRLDDAEDKAPADPDVTTLLKDKLEAFLVLRG